MYNKFMMQYVVIITIILPMDIFFTYLQHKKHVKFIEFLDKEIESLDSLIDVHSSANFDEKSI